MHKRITYFAHGIILPFILFGMSLCGHEATLDEPWQSGRIAEYITALFRPRAWCIFVPALLYSVISMATWAIAPRMETKAWVRLGIYSAVPLTLYFFVPLLIIMHIPMLIMIAIAIPAWYFVLWVVLLAIPERIQIWHIMACTAFVAVIAALYIYTGLFLLMYPIMAGFALLLAAPGLIVIAYCRAAIHMAHVQLAVPSRDKSFILGGFVALFLAWLASIYYAILVMLDEYSKFPTTNPNCYLSNAAAYAHPLLTGARCAGEPTMCMRRLKFVEIVFKAVMPRLHKLTRAHYDRYCPPLAAVCRRHMLLASITRVMLIPVELLAEILRYLLRISPSKIGAIYSLTKSE